MSTTAGFVKGAHARREEERMDEDKPTADPEEEASGDVEMCCDGSGRTAEQHRAESADHKCCIDK